ALLDGLLAALLGEPLPDLVPRPRTLDEVEPVATRPGALSFGGEDLHQVAVLQLALQGHQAAVDPCADAPVAHLGVDGVGEVHGCGPGWERDDIAAWSEDVDLTGVD